MPSADSNELTRNNSTNKKKCKQIQNNQKENAWYATERDTIERVRNGRIKSHGHKPKGDWQIG